MDVTEAKVRTEVNDAWFFPWWAVLVQGIFALIIGLLLLTHPVATTLIIVQFVGMFWLVTGIMSIVSIFADRTMWGLNLISGIIGIIFGIFLLSSPFFAALALPRVYGIFGVTGGILAIVFAFQRRKLEEPV